MSQETGEKRIRLVLLDDHGLFRASLSHFLASEPGFEVAGESGIAAEALEILNRSTVDIVLMDFDLGSERGNEFISVARQAGYRGRFLIVAGAADTRAAAMALKLGASGIFLKSEAPERFLHAIRLVADGEVWVDPKVLKMLADRLIDPYPQFEDQGSNGVLEDRERNVLLGILGGLTNRKIGANMGLSESSVKNTVQRLFGKAGVKKRSQLVRVALEGSLGMTGLVIKRHLKETPPTDQPKSNQPRRPPTTNLSSARQSHG
jgi:DNA-binding NarL/FixJ family response regulator